MRILLVTPSFFGYEEAISAAFRAKGVEVDLVDERPYNSALSRAVLRLAPSLLTHQLRRYYRGVIERTQAVPYDGLLVVKGEVVPEWFIRDFREAHPDCRCVFYTFDAITNSSHCLQLLSYFEKTYSFDPLDVAAHAGLEYKPLFYSDEYYSSDEPRDFDLAFVGTVHGIRYAFTQRIAQAASSPTRTFLHYYVPSAWFYWVSRAVDRAFWRVPRSAVSTRRMGRSEVAAVTRRSRAVIDVQRPRQAGLTMRTFEVLASGAALITANHHIQGEPFYDPAFILVVPAEPEAIDVDQVRQFLADLPSVPQVPSRLDSYSVGAWVSDFICDFSGASDAGLSRQERGR